MISIEFSEIYRTHYQRLVYQVNGLIRDIQLAEDVVQETFIKAIKCIHSLESEEKIASWLSIIARRTAIDMLRKNNNKAVLMEQENIVNLGMEMEQDVEKEVHYRMLMKEIEEEILRLSDIYQDVMTLKVKKDLKNPEIAGQLNLKLSTVKTRLSRARKLLANQLQEDISA